MSTPPISLSGLASGIDTDSIVTQLMAVEQQGRTRLTNADSQQASRQSQLQDLQTRLGAVRDAAAALHTATLWTPTQTVTSSDTSRILVSHDAGAAPGVHNIEVQKLATSEQHVFAYTAAAAASTLTITSASSPTTPFTLNVDAGASLGTIAGAINDRADAPVSAVVANGKLVFTSRATGAAAAFTIDDGNAGAMLAEDTTRAHTGTDAAYTLDGGTQLTSASNSVTDGVLGVQMTFVATTTAPVAVSVGNPAPDTNAINTKIQAFVDAYNSAGDLIRDKLGEEQVVNPQSTFDANKGLFHGDSMLSSVLSGMRASIGDLSSLGISTGVSTGTGTPSADAIAGRLVFDSTKLATTLKTDPVGVRAKLSADGGLGARVQAVVAPVAGDRINAALASAASERKNIANDLAMTDARLATKQARLKAQFSAMEAALSASNATLAQLTAQLGGGAAK